jgi:hypothetical protein
MSVNRRNIEMPAIEIGKPFPGKLEQKGGATAFIARAPGDKNGVDLMFVVMLSAPKAHEIATLINAPLDIGFVRFGSILFFILNANGKMFFDAPFGVGLYGDAEFDKLREGIQEIQDWPINIRRAYILAIVDGDTGMVLKLRRSTLRQPWWHALSLAIQECPKALSPDDYQAAIKKAQLKWPNTIAMASECLSIERSGL